LSYKPKILKNIFLSRMQFFILKWLPATSFFMFFLFCSKKVYFLPKTRLFLDLTGFLRQVTLISSSTCKEKNLMNPIEVTLTINQKNQTFVIDREQIQELFENNDLKASKQKLNQLLGLLTESDNLIESLEETIVEHLDEIISEEWGE